LKRKDAKGVKATKAVPGQYAASRPLEVVEIDHTEVDVFLVNETTRKTMDKRPWLTLAIDVFTRIVVGFHLSMERLVGPVHVERGLRQERPVEGARGAVAGGRTARDGAFGQRRRFPQPRFRMGMPGGEHQVDLSAAPHYGGHIERLIGTTMGRVPLRIDLRQFWHNRRGIATAYGKPWHAMQVHQACRHLSQVWLAFEAGGSFFWS